MTCISRAPKYLHINMVPVHSIEVNRILVFVVLLAIVGRDQIYEVVGILLEDSSLIDNIKELWIFSYSFLTASFCYT